MRESYRHHHHHPHYPPPSSKGRPTTHALAECASSSSSTSRPISLDLHTYSHQEYFLDHFYSNSGGSGSSGKENAATTAKNKGLLPPPLPPPPRTTRQKVNDPTRVSTAEYLRQSHLNQLKKTLTRRGGAADRMAVLSHTINLDAFSSTSSLSAEGFMMDGDGDGGSNSCCETEGREREFDSMALVGAKAAFYSTSDLTTSDSEIHPHNSYRHRWALPSSSCSSSREKRRERDSMRLRRATAPQPPPPLGSKFPSLSTIYPDNSSLSFDDDDEEEEEEEGQDEGLAVDLDFEAYRHHHQQQQQQQQRRQRRDNHHNQYEEDARLLKALKPRRHHQPPQQVRSAPRTPPLSRHVQSLEMIEEISPVLPPPDDANDDMDLPPVIQPLKLNKEWKPIQTSTMTNFHHPHPPPRLPKTNPRHSALLPQSLFDPHYQELAQASAPLALMDPRPEHFNLPSQLARHCDIKGILFLDITITGWTLVVGIKNGAFFPRAAINGSAPPSLPLTSCVKVELKRNSAQRKRTKYDGRLKSYRSCVVPHSNRPDFYEEFRFRLTSANLKLGDKLAISVHIDGGGGGADGQQQQPLYTNDCMLRDTLGRMSFSLRKLFKKANLEAAESVKVCEGGYFLLPEKTGSHGHLSQDNILHRKYYDEIGSSMSTTSSLQSGSPLKVGW